MSCTFRRTRRRGRFLHVENKASHHPQEGVRWRQVQPGAKPRSCWDVDAPSDVVPRRVRRQHVRPIEGPHVRGVPDVPLQITVSDSPFSWLDNVARQQRPVVSALIHPRSGDVEADNMARTLTPLPSDEASHLRIAARQLGERMAHAELPFVHQVVVHRQLPHVRNGLSVRTELQPRPTPKSERSRPQVSWPRGIRSGPCICVGTYDRYPSCRLLLEMPKCQPRAALKCHADHRIPRRRFRLAPLRLETQPGAGVLDCGEQGAVNKSSVLADDLHNKRLHLVEDTTKPAIPPERLPLDSALVNTDCCSEQPRHLPPKPLDVWDVVEHRGGGLQGPSRANESPVYLQRLACVSGHDASLFVPHCKHGKRVKVPGDGRFSHSVNGHPLIPAPPQNFGVHVLARCMLDLCAPCPLLVREVVAERRENQRYLRRNGSRRDQSGCKSLGLRISSVRPNDAGKEAPADVMLVGHRVRRATHGGKHHLPIEGRS
eukprot:scaffold1638_cov258-Pinguiococcus_pyrenoidosus.AAC.71